ncbi:MAG: isoprenylcysteine carboxylmethyltransferase family protein [Deltaproteobacteria bacterium]|nr:MAG: isoprenylcysteine carboxylmethyltransferase family protein [Deltaproteobacteria bacterium]
MKSKIAETLIASVGTLVFIAVLLPVFFIWIPQKILSSSSSLYLFDIGVFRFLGWVPIVLGVVIYFWCSHSFVFFGKGTPIPFTPTKKLVVKGLYGFVRNPMYIGGLFVLLGEALLFESKALFIYAGVIFGAFNFFILFFEEPYLGDRFGESYERYCKSVGRWIPRLTAYRENDSESSKRQ